MLALVARSGKPLSLAELCTELAMAKPTLHRLCGQLLAQGLLSHDVGSRKLHDRARVAPTGAGTR